MWALHFAPSSHGPLNSGCVRHRDLKLDNLLLVTPGNISNVKIVDFGVSAGQLGS